MNKKGFHDHPAFWFVIGLIIGAVVVYLIAKGIIPLALPIC